ncbi:MAG: hypothetical protein AB1813_10185 [Verrucomicrobiota bacterium]
MNSVAVNGKRTRRTKSAIQELANHVEKLAWEFGPIGVRGLFYKAESRGLVPKTEEGYNTVQRLLKELRLSGRVPWDWIIDVSRECLCAPTFEGVGQLLSVAAASMKLDPWDDQQNYVQVWVEKEGLAGMFSAVTEDLRVKLFPGKGYSSLSFSRVAALDAIERIHEGKQVFVLQWGDYDPSGVGISESLEEHYLIHGAENVSFIRVGLLPEHIKKWDLPTRPTKASDLRSRGFEDDRSVELDAVGPQELQQWVRDEIEKLIDWDKWQATLNREKPLVEEVLRLATQYDGGES